MPRAIAVLKVGERRKVSSPSRVTMAGEETRETVGRRTTRRGRSTPPEEADVPMSSTGGCEREEGRAAPVEASGPIGAGG
jgi:hypothetical protein